MLNSVFECDLMGIIRLKKAWSSLSFTLLDASKASCSDLAALLFKNNNRRSNLQS